MDSQQIPIGTISVSRGLRLTMTEQGWRAETQHRKLRRLNGWDYHRPCTYLITIGCQRHQTPPRPIGIPDDDRSVQPLPAEWRYPEWLLRAYSKAGRPHLFGEVAGRAGAASAVGAGAMGAVGAMGSAPEAQSTWAAAVCASSSSASSSAALIALTPFGLEVDALIRAIPAWCPQVRILRHVVMPNHIHMVVQVIARLPEKQALGNVINRFKSYVNRAYKHIALGLPASTLVEVANAKPVQSLTQHYVRKQGRGCTHPKNGLVFEADFHDRIAFSQQQLQRMLQYVDDNPKRLWQITQNRQYFVRLHNLPITMPYLPTGGTKGWGRCQAELTGLLAPITYDPPLPTAQQTNEQPADWQANPPQRQTVTFNMMGNRFLLDSPCSIQIQVSRKASAEEIAAYQADILAACEHGVVPVSPCISPGERQIARAVLEAAFPLIVLMPRGIPADMKQKVGYAEYYEACAAGRLLMLSPWGYQEKEQELQRWQCLFLNDLSLQLTLDNNFLSEDTE